jgi:drug/metabolite transporter (DMT)-like permease
MNVNKPSSSTTNWLLFLALSFLWGSSYLFIKIGVEAGLPPITLVLFRMLSSAIFLGVVVAIAREHLPRTRVQWQHLTVIAVIGIVLPFILITVAEQSVDSALAAILVAPVPLLTIPIAAALLPDEKVTANKVAGVVVGLLGVAILVGFDPSQIGTSDFVAQMMLLGATASYALNGVYARRFVKGSSPAVTSFSQVFMALLMVGVLAFAVEEPLAVEWTAEAIFAVVWLGLLGSGLAFLCFFRLLRTWGAGRTSLVAYVMPLWGIGLGAIFLGEVIDVGMIVGSALVIAGIALVNVKRDSIAGAWANWRGRNESPAEPIAEPVADRR